MILFKCYREFSHLPHGVYYYIDDKYARLNRNDGMSAYRRLYNYPSLTYDYCFDGKVGVKSEIFNIKQKLDVM